MQAGQLMVGWFQVFALVFKMFDVSFHLVYRTVVAGRLCKEQSLAVTRAYQAVMFLAIDEAPPVLNHGRYHLVHVFVRGVLHTASLSDWVW